MVPNPRQPMVAHDPSADERRQLAHVREDLVREFAALPTTVVDQEVARLVDTFRQAPVRSFVPVLVRRVAREHLRHLV